MPPVSDADANAGPARVVIVDDHAIVREGLRVMLDAEPDVTVVGEAADAATAQLVVSETKPDLVLLDLRLGADERSGLDLCATLRAGHPDVGVLVVTTFLSERLVIDAIRAGAQGYVLKDVDSEQLVKAVAAVRRGESAFDSHSAAVVVRSLATEASGEGGDQASPLSAREQEVATLVGRGLSNQEIGAALFISTATVKFHLRNIMGKLGVHRRAELAFRAGRLDRP